MSKAVVLLSGGQDSTTCLYWARTIFDEVRALSIDYGQRHRIELDAARAIAELAGIEHAVVELGCLSGPALACSPLVGEGDVQGKNQDGLAVTFVPGRNLLFLTVAAAHAYKHGFLDLVTGVCETDYSGYPDCRRHTMDVLGTALDMGMERDFQIHTPLMRLTKAESVALAQRLPGCWEGLALSVTCYEGQVPACGACPACELRARGFQDAGVPDPAGGAAA